MEQFKDVNPIDDPCSNGIGAEYECLKFMQIDRRLQLFCIILEGVFLMLL